MKIKVLYEDANILAINKPSGILTQPDQRSKEKTIFDFFIKKYPKLELVHRLDKETSGVLLLAKNQNAHQFLKSQFMNRELKKVYYAVVSGFVKNDHGFINKSIGRSPSDFRRRLSGRGARGELREAITEYKVLKHFNAKAYQNFYPRGSRFEPEAPEEGRRGKSFGMPELFPFTFLEVKPKTGRTHQIRVHMKFLNHPVACDSLYNPNGPCPSGFSRLALHASSIEFKNLKGKIIKVESPLPKEFANLLKRNHSTKAKLGAGLRSSK